MAETKSRLKSFSHPLMPDEKAEGFIERNRQFFLLGIILVATILIFAGLMRADIQTDDALYSVRGIGYLDFLDSQLQTTPILWFDSVPFWSKLSFHDAPPLVFAIQFLFFKILGITTFAARLPFALAGIGVVLLVYFFVRRLFGTHAALLASGLLAILNYHIWASQVGYLEIMSLFFIILTLYLFIRAVTHPVEFIFFGISLGLTMITKYTSFFVLPALLMYVLIYQRPLIKNGYIWLGAAAAALIVSPVAYYNIKMFQTRGHFDLQFARLFHQSMADWTSMSPIQATNFLGNADGLWRQLVQMYSLPMFLLLAVSVVYIFIFSVWQWRPRQEHVLIGLLTFFLLIQFLIIGSTMRFDSTINPFLTIAAALMITELLLVVWRLGRKKRWLWQAAIGVLVVICGFELFYTINTNVLPKPIGAEKIMYSEGRWPNGGFNQLEQYLTQNEPVTIKPDKPIHSLNDLIVNFNAMPTPYVYVYDHNLSWFSSLWYFRRYSIYGGTLFVSDNDLGISLKNINWFQYFHDRGIKAIYFIRGENSGVLGASFGDSKKQELADKLEKIFQTFNASAVSINNNEGELAFKIYKLNLN